MSPGLRLHTLGVLLRQQLNREPTLIRFLFLIPLLLCLGWFVYLKQNGYTLEQGKKGFIYILVISSAIAAFYGILIPLTH